MQIPHSSGKCINTTLMQIPYSSGKCTDTTLVQKPHRSGTCINTTSVQIPHSSGRCIDTTSLWQQIAYSILTANIPYSSVERTGIKVRLYLQRWAGGGLCLCRHRGRQCHRGYDLLLHQEEGLGRAGGAALPQPLPHRGHCRLDG